MIDFIHVLIHWHIPVWHHYHDYEISEDWCENCKGVDYHPLGVK